MALVLASGSRFAMLARFAAAFDSAPLRASLGQIVSTPGALEALRENGSTGMEFLRRHMTGDWATCATRTGKRMISRLKPDSAFILPISSADW